MKQGLVGRLCFGKSAFAWRCVVSAACRYRLSIVALVRIRYAATPNQALSPSCLALDMDDDADVDVPHELL